MKKVLFLIHDLGHGGAEKVLVNLVNNLDQNKYDVTVMTLFGGGVNEQFLKEHIHYKTIYNKTFPGNSHFMKLFSPEKLHEMYIKDYYDIEIAFLEGPAARIISGCNNPNTKLVYWIHCTMHSIKELSIGFRSYNEAKKCYGRFNGNVFVSEEVRLAFEQFCPINNSVVLYNTNESDEILLKANEPLYDEIFNNKSIKIIAMGKIEYAKGFDRLAEIHKNLIKEGFDIHTYILGAGSKQKEIENYLENNNLTESFTFLGYQVNPYKYIKNSDLFVCSSHSEGYSTAATEALIVGIPVITTEVSGMRELLGENGEWGIILKNDTDSLYKGIKNILLEPEKLKEYKNKSSLRGKNFSTKSTVKAVEDWLDRLLEK